MKMAESAGGDRVAVVNNSGRMRTLSTQGFLSCSLSAGLDTLSSLWSILFARLSTKVFFLLFFLLNFSLPIAFQFVFSSVFLPLY